MTALGFDPRGVPKISKQGYPPPNAPKPPNPPPVAAQTHPPPTTEPPGLGELGGLGGGQGENSKTRDHAAFLLRWAEDAFVALVGPELDPDPPLEDWEIDHGDAERAALVEHHAEPMAVPPAEPGPVYCFPCGRPVLLRDRTWSEARGWCCAACAAKRAANGGIP